jgi:uncharacterized protein (DUF1778 family)
MSNIDTKEKSHHGLIGQKNAMLSDETLDSRIAFRVSKADKSAFFKAASGKKLSQWIVDTLKKEAGIL